NEEEAKEQNRPGQHRADVRDRKDSRPKLERRVAFRVLDDMADLVRRDADRRERRLGVVVGRKGDLLVDRIVVVGEKSLTLLDLDVGDSVLTKNGLRDLSAASAARSQNLAELGVSRLNLRLRVEGQNHRRDQKQHRRIPEHKGHLRFLLGAYRFGGGSSLPYTASPGESFEIRSLLRLSPGPLGFNRTRPL